MPGLLIADESNAVRKVAGDILTEFGFSVVECVSALDAMARCSASLPDAIIVDSNLDGALELIVNLRLMPNGKSVRVLYSVSEADLRKLMCAKRAGADDFLLKPLDHKVLGATFAEMLAKSAAA